MRLLSAIPIVASFWISLNLSANLSAQMFPTLDPNASPAVTKVATAPLPAPPPVEADIPQVKVQPIADAKGFSADLIRPRNAYILGPQDSLTIHVANMDEIAQEPYSIDLQGYLTLPRVGQVQAAGLTVDQLRLALISKFKEYLQEPIISITVTVFLSQPVSVLGAVGTPGVHQIKGNKTLFEVISEAGGLKADAGNKITITRQMINGPLPLANAQTDSSGHYSIADLNIRSVMSARNPQENIPVKPNDVITVPKADLIYVIGAVKKPGGFPLQERANMTVLEALSLSEGLDKLASSRKARILRTNDTTHARLEIPIDVQKILNGKGTDLALMSNDILFVPTSATKTASIRAIEAIVQVGTGLAIYRP